MHVDFSALRTSRILPCDGHAGYRDPAAIIQDGRLYCFYSYVERSDDGVTDFRLGLSVSDDLENWQYA